MHVNIFLGDRDLGKIYLDNNTLRGEGNTKLLRSLVKRFYKHPQDKQEFLQSLPMRLTGYVTGVLHDAPPAAVKYRAEGVVHNLGPKDV